jgi:hypothetical protein
MLPKVSERAPSPPTRDGRRGRRGSAVQALASAVVLTLFALAGASAPAGASTHVSPASVAATRADTATTYAYLQAVYQLDQAILRNAVASRAAAKTESEQIGDECRGVLTGAHIEGPGAQSEGPATARAAGELARSELQVLTIEEELEATIHRTAYQLDRAAVEAFAAQIAGLGWSNARIAPLVRSHAGSLEKAFALPATDVCAEMKAWAQSGYHILPPASREFEAAERARANAVRPEASIGSLLEPYEGPPARSLMRNTQTLSAKLESVLSNDPGGFSQLLHTLGLRESASEADEHEAVVLGYGTTSAGDSFTVRGERAESGPEALCRPVSIEIQGESRTFATSVCLSGREGRQPLAECRDGLDLIVTAVPASARTARLLLSNGHTIASRVIHVPRQYGGPGGVYVQAVRGGPPHPILLTELNARAKVVGAAKLAAVRCRREPATPAPRYVELTKGSTPAGEPFTIQAVSFSLSHGQTHLRLAPIQIGVRRNANVEIIEIGNVESKAFPWSLAMGCQPNEFAIVYGILSPPGDSVLARTREGLVPLTAVPIAADLHAGGPLVYGVFPTLPSELVVRGSDGATLYTESLAAKDKEEAEFCAGYAEA